MDTNKNEEAKQEETEAKFDKPHGIDVTTECRDIILTVQSVKPDCLSQEAAKITMIEDTDSGILPTGRALACVRRDHGAAG